jgi:hypothetical protein
MFDEMIYQFRLRKHQRERARISDGYRRKFEALVRSKGDRDQRDRLRFEEEMDLREVDDEINMLTTMHMRSEARRYIVHFPDFTDTASWVKSDTFGHTYLTPLGVQKVRADIRAEQKARYDFWQSRVTLTLALVGSIFGVLAYFRR